MSVTLLGNEVASQDNLEIICDFLDLKPAETTPAAIGERLVKVFVESIEFGNPMELRRLFTLRAEFDLEAAIKLSQKRNTSDLRKLNKIVSNMREAEQSRGRKLRKLLGFDIEFHASLSELAGHRKVAELIRSWNSPKVIVHLERIIGENSCFISESHQLFVDSIFTSFASDDDLRNRVRLHAFEGHWQKTMLHRATKNAIPTPAKKKKQLAKGDNMSKKRKDALVAYYRNRAKELVGVVPEIVESHLDLMVDCGLKDLERGVPLARLDRNVESLIIEAKYHDVDVLVYWTDETIDGEYRSTAKIGGISNDRISGATQEERFPGGLVNDWEIIVPGRRTIGCVAI